MLEYDNSAFYYFMIASCTVYLIPSTWHVFKKLSFLMSNRKVDVGTARSSVEQKKYERLEEEQRNSKAGMSTPFIANMVATICTWVMFFYLISLVWNDHEIASFDPFAILGIEAGAKMRVIKRAYRALSLQYHPDKNKGDAHAEQMFMKIAKAYEALTDEDAKANYEKYGNPDGRQSMEVSIGLPTFLVEQDNHQVILIIYLLVLVVAIPLAVCLWYNESKQYMDNMIRHDTMAWYHHMLSEHTHLKSLPEILAGSREFVKKMKIRQNQLGAFGALESKLRDRSDQMQKEKYQYRPPEKSKVYYLLHAHVFKIFSDADGPKEEQWECLESDLLLILEKSPYLIEGMLQYAASRRWMQTVTNIIEFSQRLVQCVWVKDSSLLQIPHFGDDEVRHALRKKTTRKVLDWINSDETPRAGTKDFSAQEMKDVDAAIKCIPNMEASFSVSVADEEDIHEGDMLTLTVVMNRKNLQEGEECDMVHAPFWPGKRKETWWIFGGMKNELHFFKKLTNQGARVEEKVQVPGPSEARSYEIDVHLMCDSYVDCDVHSKVKFIVKPRSLLPAYKPHEEDAALDEEPTMYDSVLDAYALENAGSGDESRGDDDSSSDDDGEWDENSYMTAAQVARKKARRAKQKAKKKASEAGEGDEQKGAEEGTVDDGSNSSDDE
jgi:translocation protein SEC63